MNQSVSQTAAKANETVYNSGWTEIFVEGAPHLKHASLRTLFARLLQQTIEQSAKHTPKPRVLDICAGEGSVTQELVARGAHVTAVDISISQLAELQRKCEPFGNRLQIHRGEISQVLGELSGPFDVVVASACLHHLPDYLGVIGFATNLLTPHGQFLSFQDPLRYDSLGWLTRVFA